MPRWAGGIRKDSLRETQLWEKGKSSRGGQSQNGVGHCILRAGGKEKLGRKNTSGGKTAGPWERWSKTRKLGKKEEDNAKYMFLTWDRAAG